MTDREKVISGLKCHVNLKCHNCPYVDAIHPAYGCHLEELIADALALLKEQEGIIKTLEDKNTKLMLLINEYLKKEREAEAVVRCKDCKYCEYPEAEREWCKKGHLHGNAETWFCADGERR